MLVLNRKTIEIQSGNFSSWWENKRRQDQFAEAQNEKNLKEIEPELFKDFTVLEKITFNNNLEVIDKG